MKTLGQAALEVHNTKCTIFRTIQKALSDFQIFFLQTLSVETFDPKLQGGIHLQPNLVITSCSFGVKTVT